MRAILEAWGPPSLSDAICAYLHWGSAMAPASDPEAVHRLLAYADSDALVAQVILDVEAAIEDSEQMSISDAQFHSVSGGEEVRGMLAARRPDLDDEAVRALVSRLFYKRLR